ncbi:MAG: ABC transporter permease, partial [Henriciella sp.]
MLADIIRFELRYQLKSPVFISVFAIFFLLTFGAITIDQIQIGSTSAVNVNSPHAIIQTILVWTLFGMFIPTAFLVSGILRDSSFNTQELFYTTPVRERDYLIGRFIGGAFASVLAFASVPLAIMLGAIMPWLDPDLIGPFVLGHYAYGMFVFGVPNLMIAGMLMFSVANLTRSNMLTYVALVSLLIVYFVATEALQNPQYRNLMALADPFGFSTYAEATRYYTAGERNTLVPPLEGQLLANRLIWLGVAAALFAFNVVIFRFRKAGLKLFGRRGAAATSPSGEIEHIVLPRTAPSFSRGAILTLFGSRVWFEIKGVVFNVAFWVLLALGIFNTLGALVFTVSAYGTPNYPVTRIMVDLIVGAFSLVPLIVIIFYSSEVIWRERGLRFNEVIDATPAPSWVFVFSKYIAMLCVLAGLFLVVTLTTMLVQLMRGYADVEVGQYIQRLVIDIGLPLSLIAVLAIFFQVLMNNRWLGMLAVLVVFIGSLVLDNIGFEHNLYDFGGRPGAPYSDMNGFGHFLAISAWFYLYWAAISVILLILSYLLWNRGTLTPIMARLRRLGGSFGPATAIAGLSSVATAVSVGGWIYYNTVIVNDYVPGPAAERRAAAFERGWGERLLDLPQPKITDVSVDVDIYPETRRYEARGHYTLENKTDAPISRVWLSYNEAAIIDRHEMDNASLAEFDADSGIYGFDFETAMQPGERRDLRFAVRVENPGFRNTNNVSSVNHNGSFFNNYEAMPSIGVSQTAFLQDPQARRRQGLEPIQRAYALEDESRWREHYLRNDSDFVSFRTIVSTSHDQIAVAPGYLEREWDEGDRRYFEYVMDAPILNFYSWLSA